MQTTKKKKTDQNTYVLQSDTYMVFRKELLTKASRCQEFTFGLLFQSTTLLI